MSEHGVTSGSHAETIDRPRRRFFGTAAMTIAATRLGVIGSAAAQANEVASKVPAIKPGTNTSFKALKQISAGLLNVGYAEDGPADGSAVVPPTLAFCYQYYFATDIGQARDANGAIHAPCTMHHAPCTMHRAPCTVHRAPRIAISSRASMSTASSPAASGTTCPRRLLRPSPKL
jgi:hypothetical protein